MKNVTLFLGMCLMAVAVFFSSCAKEEAKTLLIEESANIESLVLKNTIVDTKEDAITLNLSPKAFQEVLDATFSVKNYNIQKFFTDADARKTFRENIQQIFIANKLEVAQDAEKGACDHTYYAEAYTDQEGYTSSSSNSFVYAKRYGDTGLWASAFSCVTFDEAYSGYYSVCPYPNYDECMVRALYSGNSGSAAIFGVNY